MIKYIFILFTVFKVYSQQNGQPDPSFYHGSNTSWGVFVITEQSDGKLIIGGDFTTINQNNSNYQSQKIARFHSNGKLDTTFNYNANGFDSWVEALAVENITDKIIAGGNFNNYKNKPVSKLARLHVNGDLDTTFNYGGTGITYTNGIAEVSSIEKQTDGKLIIAGRFDKYNSTSSPFIIRLNSDGTPDINFNVNLGFDNLVTSLKIQPDGKVLAGGYFTTYNNNSSNNFVRINSNGSFDNSFITGTGFNGPIEAICVQSDGKIIVGGDFTIFNGNNCNRICRLNNNGSLDTLFKIGTGVSLQKVWDIKHYGNKLLVAGDFQAYNGQSVKNIILIDQSGKLDTTFYNYHVFKDPSNYSMTGGIQGMHIQSDQKIIIIGSVSIFLPVSQQQSGLIRLNATPVGINVINKLNYLKIYPNPTANQFKILASEIIKRIVLTNVLGKEIMNMKINSDAATIDLSNHENGVYCILIECENETIFKKIIKAR